MTPNRDRFAALRFAGRSYNASAPAFPTLRRLARSNGKARARRLTRDGRPCMLDFQQHDGIPA
jgi:hypothetical protein